MQTKINELGRSMVEMLGVLAIIGVLSVAGVATYQYALTAYQAGKVQDVLGKAKTLAQTDSRASHALEVNRFIKSALPEYVPDDKKSMVKLVNGNYQVTAFKVVYKVCEKLLQKEGILNDMGISILTKTCGNKNTKTSMVFAFNATPTFESGSHFGGGSGSGNNGSGSSDLPDIDNPNIEPQSCPDKMVWRQKEDGTYGCVCRHEYEFGDNCERCYPPKEWFEDETTCRCPDMTPVWHNEECVECIDNSTCQIPNLVCDTSNNTCKSCPDERPFYNINSTNTDKCEKCPDATPIHLINTNECIACPRSAPYWNGTECSPNECESNEDCHKLYNNDTTYFCTRGDNICETETFTNAHCKKLKYDTFVINGVTFYASLEVFEASLVGWQSAINFCTALGKQMVSVPDLGCSNNIHIGDTTASCSSNTKTIASTLKKTLVEVGSGGTWIAFDPWLENGDRTCTKACLHVDENRINTGQGKSNHHGTHYALCRDWGPMCFAPYTREGDKCVCPTGTYDTGTTCITCPKGSTWSDEHKTCILTVTIESGTNQYTNAHGAHSLSQQGWLNITFPENITTGKWQLVGINQIANLSASVKLGICPQWESNISLVDNVIDLDSNTISNVTLMSNDQEGCIYDGRNDHGQHFYVQIKRPNTNTIQILMYVNSHRSYANPFYATATVSLSTVQAILVE